MLAAAQVALDAFIDHHQRGGYADADEPLLQAKCSRAKKALQEAYLRHEKGERKGQAEESYLAPILKNITVEHGFELIASCEASEYLEKREGCQGHCASYDRADTA